MTVYLKQYAGEKNSLPRLITISYPYTGNFRGECDVLNPVLEIAVDSSHTTDLLSINYVTIPSLGRSYFVESVTIDPNGLYVYNLHVDVLGTYSAKILSSKAFINRNENDYNDMIIDKKMELMPAETYEVVKLTSSTPFKSYTTSSNLTVVVGFGSIIPNANNKGGD